VQCSTQEIQELWNWVKGNLFCSNQMVANRYNQGCIPQPFKVGDLVYCKKHPLSRAAHQVSAKLSSQWQGPLRIDQFSTLVTVTLVDPVKDTYVTRVHLSQMKTADSPCLRTWHNFFLVSRGKLKSCVFFIKNQFTVALLYLFLFINCYIIIVTGQML
jgi:hypothetical protein